MIMINGVCLKNAIISGANNISKNKSKIDDLNIFPVPDGDTGTNMSMTINSALPVLQDLECSDVAVVSEKTASALLRGARGNSGVILSLIFRGFSIGLKEKESADGKDLVDALGRGVEAAYKAVMKPTEGTILTVARMAFEAGSEIVATENDPVIVWETMVKAAKEALAGGDFLPEFSIADQTQFITFIKLVNGTAATRMTGLTRGEVRGTDQDGFCHQLHAAADEGNRRYMRPGGAGPEPGQAED